MDDDYYELFVYVEHKYFSLLQDFILELTSNAIEIKEDCIIIRSSDSLENVEFGIKEYVKELSTIVGSSINIDLKNFKKQNKDWIAEYQQSVQPIYVDKFFIRPSWVEADTSKTNIIIDPALAFGSGHHESTNSIIKILPKYIKKGQNILDVGCGSGILGICAAKSEAKVDICDTDENAIKSSLSNFKINNVDVNKSWIGTCKITDGTYDVVIANIITDVLLMIKKNLVSNLKDGGILILSGILNQYKNKIIDKYEALELLESIPNGDWITLIFQKR